MTHAEWAPLIRRCALHERTNILGAVEAAIRGPSATVATASQEAELRQWHDAAYEQFKADVQQYETTNFLAQNNVQYSYSILRADGQKLDPDELRETLLLQMNNEVKDRVRTGWSMFYPFTRQELAPHFVVDEASGEGQEDFLECALLRAPDRLPTSTDMWRITTSGKVTLIRPYWEDKPDWNLQIGKSPGTWFSPNLQVRAIAELIRHAEAFSEKFNESMSVNFLCEWRGLKNRTLDHPGSHFSIECAASADKRRVTKEASVAAINGAWPEVTTDLVAPVVRLFNGSFRVSPEWIQGLAPNWGRWG